MGGDAATVAAMTEKARQLGALDTRPATPSGLDGPGMATSAYDLAVLFRQAMGEPLFAETIATREIPFPGYGDRPGFVLSNVNPLLSRYPGTLGSKTGFTDAARHTIVGAAERDGRRLVVSVVRAENTPVVNWRQAAALLDWGFALPADAPPVGTLVDAAPPPLTASAGTPGPSGTFTAPLTRGVPLPGGIVLPGGLATIAGTAAAAIAVVLLALTLARRRRRTAGAGTRARAEPEPEPATAAHERASRYRLARECNVRGRPLSGPERNIRGPIRTDSRGSSRTFPRGRDVPTAEGWVSGGGPRRAGRGGR